MKNKKIILLFVILLIIIFVVGFFSIIILVRYFSWKNRHFPEKIDRRHICSQSSQSSQIIK